MRLADAVLRQGHLSEPALLDALLSERRPRHLDRCDLCSERAVDLARWLDDLRAMGTDMADDAFAPEQIKIQHDQILRRLEQLDQRPRVIAFPGLTRPDLSMPAGRRVAPAWLGVAAAAGLVLGIIGGQLTARMGLAEPTATGTTATATDVDGLPQPAPGGQAEPLLIDLEQAPASLSALDEMMPTLTMASNSAGG